MKKHTKIINEKNHILKSNEEAFIILAMDNFAQHEGEQFILENEMLKKDPNYQLSNKVRQKFKETVSHHCERTTPNLWQAVFNSLNIKTIIIATLFFLVSTSLLIDNDIISRLIFPSNIQEHYSDTSENRDKQSLEKINRENAYHPTIVPSGYYIDRTQNTGGVITIEYKDDAYGIIIFEQFSQLTSSNIDTKGADMIENIKIHGYEGLFIKKDQAIIVTWDDGVNIFSVSAINNDLQKLDIIKMAESVEEIK